MENNKHFICTGNCRGVSNKQGVCQAKSCMKHNKPLELCDCKDNKHNGRQWAGEEGKSRAVSESGDYEK